MTSRRGFLKAMGITVAAPAIVRAESLMKIVVPSKEIIIPTTEDIFNMMTSKNGIDWFPAYPNRALPSCNKWRTVAYSNGVFVAMQ
jgi:hypothetical protein